MTENFNLEAFINDDLHGVFKYPDQALLYAKHLESRLKVIDDDGEKAKVLGNLGVTYLHLRELKRAKENLEKSLSKAEKKDLSTDFKIQQSIRLANVFQWSLEFEKADRLFLETMELCRADNSFYLDLALQHFGKSLFDQKKYDEALVVFKDALELRKVKGIDSLIASTNLAILKTKTRKIMTNKKYSNLSKLYRDVLELESENMIDVLEAIGIKHDPDKLLEGLEKPQEIVTYYKGEKLYGLVRYSVDDLGKAKVWSIQIKNPDSNKAILLYLIKKAAQSMKDSGVLVVNSVVQKSNHDSINLHQKLGFSAEKECEKTISYNAKFSDLAFKYKIK